MKLVMPKISQKNNWPSKWQQSCDLGSKTHIRERNDDMFQHLRNTIIKGKICLKMEYFLKDHVEAATLGVQETANYRYIRRADWSIRPLEKCEQNHEVQMGN